MELNLLKKFEVFNTEGGVPCPTAWEQFTFWGGRKKFETELPSRNP